MADEIPPNWYPDATGTVRWWDGKQWTEQVRDDPAETGSAPPTDVFSTPDPFAATDSFPATEAFPAYVRKPVNDDTSHYDNSYQATGTPRRRVWLTATFVGLLAFFLGLGIGGYGVPSDQPIVAATPTPPPAPVTPTPDPEQERRQAALDEREQELDDRELELDERESATPSPTPTEDPEDDEDARREIMHEGRWKIGRDVPAGTYTTDGPTDDVLECTYEVSSDKRGQDVIDDDSSYGPMTVALSDGQYFTTDNCQTWQVR